MNEAGPQHISFSSLLHEGGPIAHLNTLFQEAYAAARVAAAHRDNEAVQAAIRMMNRVNDAMTLFPDQCAEDGIMRCAAGCWQINFGMLTISSGEKI
ncbi:MAG: hypothetical protein ABS35_46135 [Kaistia sp. SCN 65-12]|nr:MAG: hypothetical protein ABS35_46135 [Kaistia sp. SCN 65-12]